MTASYSFVYRESHCSLRSYLSLGDESTAMAAYCIEAAGKSGCGNVIPKHDAIPTMSLASNPSAAISTSEGTSADEQ